MVSRVRKRAIYLLERVNGKVAKKMVRYYQVIENIINHLFCFSTQNTQNEMKARDYYAQHKNAKEIE